MVFPRSTSAKISLRTPDDPPIKRHDHRRSIWVIGGYLWCYRCGAIRENRQGTHAANPWIKPTGPDGANPAMSKP